MGGKDEETQARARRTLVSTLCKIADLDPMLGGKWQAGMLRYYAERLAEVLLGSTDGSLPSVAREDMAQQILSLLASGDLDGQ